MNEDVEKSMDDDVDVVESIEPQYAITNGNNVEVFCEVTYVSED